MKPIHLSTSFKKFFNEKYKESPFGYQTTTTLYTSYLGPVEVPVWESPIADTVYLQMTNPNGILVKVLNIEDVISVFGTAGLPGIEFLRKITPASVNITENKEVYEKIQKCLKYKTSDIFKNDDDLLKMINNQLKELYTKNICVDIFFNSIMYLEFIKEQFNLTNINDSKDLISIYNIPDLDNAFFTGSYMCYGNGDNLFYPLGSPEIAGHELGHSIIEETAGLEYFGESGALNESFADILGSTFDFWLHKKYANLEGMLPSWYIGTTIGYSVIFLRNMENPEKSPFQQPYEYKGQFWADTNDSHDEGGVHTNSGPCNRCYFLVSKEITVEKSIQIFFKCLCELTPTSQYIDFGKTLVLVCPEEHSSVVKNALAIIKVPI